MVPIMAFRESSHNQTHKYCQFMKKCLVFWKISSRYRKKKEKKIPQSSSKVLQSLVLSPLNSLTHAHLQVRPSALHTSLTRHFTSCSHCTLHCCYEAPTLTDTFIHPDETSEHGGVAVKVNQKEDYNE